MNLPQSPPVMPLAGHGGPLAVIPPAKASQGRRLRLMLGVLLLLILIAMNLAIGLGKVQIDKVVSESMEPTLRIGDVILSDADAVPERYSIIVFTPPGNPAEKLVKRIIGMPGDRIVIQDGIVSINGREEYSRHVADNVLDVRDMKVDVPENEYFVLGDNRNHSYDSIHFSTVPLANIRGVARWIIWPWKRRGGFAPFLE